MLYRPIFDRLGVNAKLNLVAGHFDITALDKTAGVSLPDGNVIVETLKPGAELLMVDLAALGIVKTELDEQTITLFDPGVDTSDIANGVTWHIISHKVHPSPNGDQDGKIILILEGDGE